MLRPLYNRTFSMPGDSATLMIQTKMAFDRAEYYGYVRIVRSVRSVYIFEVSMFSEVSSKGTRAHATALKSQYRSSLVACRCTARPTFLFLRATCACWRVGDLTDPAVRALGTSAWRYEEHNGRAPCLRRTHDERLCDRPGSSTSGTAISSQASVLQGVAHSCPVRHVRTAHCRVPCQSSPW